MFSYIIKSFSCAIKLDLISNETTLSIHKLIYISNQQFTFHLVFIHFYKLMFVEAPKDSLVYEDNLYHDYNNSSLRFDYKGFSCILMAELFTVCKVHDVFRDFEGRSLVSIG